MIRTRGPHVMLGYWSASGSALRPQPDTWLETGDMGEQQLPCCAGARLVKLLMCPPGTIAAWIAVFCGLHAGYLDAGGQLWLLGRGSDVIRSGSETVHASEVENSLQRHPDVLAAAVVGLPHARLGEQVLMSSLSCRACSSW
jgi:acyl-CoA synthetase (AMP-forming)/AMP-acid ligase II